MENSSTWMPEEGRPEPLGALARDGGVNFAVASEHARAIELCLFDAVDGSETRRLLLHGPFEGIFHGFLPGAVPGQVYGLRAQGPHAPSQGHRFNPHKLLLDPWAREIVGSFEWRPEHHGYVLGQSVETLDTRDNAPWALKARVAPPPSIAPGWLNAPRHKAADLVLYEVHVKGFSQQHPGIPAELRGTYAALAHPVAIAHFKRLGVTTLSLLPVHYHLDEPMLPAGLVNYWGYNTLGYFCPDPRLARRGDDPAAVNDEFRRMVATLHDHGLEVVLDVVFNHTPEGNEQGPTLSLRGLDQRSWYRVQGNGRLENLTACGNTVNVAHPQVTRFVLDSLRHWVQAMGVDGFRFDLAPVLGRGADGGFQREAAFFTALAQDPVLAQVHLIAEPWDAGPEGYRLGDFPGRWMEWNDKFRDAVRGFWLGAEAERSGITRAEFAERFGGSADIYARAKRRPTSSVNFVAVHDGFTLADLVSYGRKHNHANGEGNRDGRDDELSANFGAEGPTDDPEIIDTRLRVRRAMMASLLLAQGTPMLCAGDEFGNSQGGNNNAWNQDNATGWLGWADADEGFAAFVAELTALRRSQPLLRPAQWVAGAQRWQGLQDASRALACEIGLDARHPLLVAFNPAAVELPLPLPPGEWRVLLDTGARAAAAPLRHATQLVAHSLCVLRREAL